MFLRNITSAIVAAIIPLVASAVEPTRYNLKVNDFTELKIVDDINVIYRNHPDSVGAGCLFRYSRSGIGFYFSTRRIKA